ncbi:2-oxoglutarate ferredoxin oxidoreductase subunit alpha [Proteiniborus sp. DW1]|uniref:3-methyl-2-oxobutanoate dehydrogenase subunit VorB n=1 Tax=Proteiniborus sp. DW1 TaxID=1889883 RepID=UPI00092E128E|nr:3-methyl-2-oxobutanoate dehydrogenase subunit VorB [Proteiniborus sp. DW1]SCG83997.1 2-oxoglutarate ferredoxin oxidoreductase subunit alpha [Proteiniborus sp. DW1]
MSKVLMKGNEAVGAAAIKAGCKYFFGYPITPQNEIPEFMARELPKVGGVFLQAESEIAAINMVYGAAGSGARVMTSSSSPGIALKQEGISYIAGAELPCVIVNMVRGGPGLGGIQPSQSDYFQATRGGGNGDYRHLVYAPASIQEAVDLVMEAFDVADYYRNPVIVLGDGMIGQMMEPVEFKEPKKRELPPKDWATTGTKGQRKPNVINSLYIEAQPLEDHNLKLEAKYAMMKENEVRYEEYNLEDAEVVIVAYGTTSRIAKNAIAKCAEEGIKVGLIRPITLWPFPDVAFDKISDKTKAVLTVEMSTGQMVDDVKIAVNGRKPVYFYGRTGGMVPTPNAIVDEIKKIVGGDK